MAGALNGLAEHRRSALWQVEESGSSDELFRLAPMTETEPVLSPLERMTHLERLQADYATLGLTTGRHPMALMRPQMTDTVRAGDLKQVRHGAQVKVAGSVITRQRPGTAKGVCFITLEDESGHANAIVWPKLFEEYRLVINLESALVITGHVQNESGVVHVIATAIAAMPGLGMPEQASHDYR